jgi:DNA-binding MarR family transcriptional regulator
MAARNSAAQRVFEDVAATDRLVHEPARLVLLTALSACKSADFVFLQRLSGLQAGNLSQHLAKLEQAGLITVTKGFSGKYPQTTVAITDDGKKALDDHWSKLDALRKTAKGSSWRQS